MSPVGLWLGAPLRAQLPWGGQPVIAHQLRELRRLGHWPIHLEGQVPPEIAALLPEDGSVVPGPCPPGVPRVDCRRPLGAPGVDLARPATVPRQGWLVVRQPRPGLTVFSEPLGTCSVWRTSWVHSYLIRGRERALLVDSGTGLGGVAALARESGTEVVALHTHGDWDHVGECGAFPWAWGLGSPGRIPRRTLERCLHRSWVAPWRPDPPAGWPLAPCPMVAPPSRIELGGVELRVLPAPGHTPDGLVLYDAERGELFAGDAVYAGELWARDVPTFWRTWTSLLSLPGLVRICGGHGPVPASPETVRRVARMGGPGGGTAPGIA